MRWICTYQYRRWRSIPLSLVFLRKLQLEGFAGSTIKCMQSSAACRNGCSDCDARYYLCLGLLWYRQKTGAIVYPFLSAVPPSACSLLKNATQHIFISYLTSRKPAPRYRQYPTTTPSPPPPSTDAPLPPLTPPTKSLHHHQNPNTNPHRSHNTKPALPHPSNLKPIRPAVLPEEEALPVCEAAGLAPAALGRVGAVKEGDMLVAYVAEPADCQRVGG